MMTVAQSQFETARVYHDFNSLTQLKTQGKDDSPEAIREAARQFESIFVRMMLKSMRDANAAIIDEPLFDSTSLDLYKDMHDEQLSLHLSRSQSGFGLTDILVKQLTVNPSKTDTSSKSDTAKNFNPQIVSRAPMNPQVKIVSGNSEQLNSIQPKQQITKNLEERTFDFSSPSEFVKSLWPYAEKAAKLLQLDPKVLIAQAALETGWGKFMMKTSEGVSSKNLFGIKSNNNWSGEKAQVNTLELEEGTLTKKKAEFRVYDSYAQSFSDYTQFISGKERYQKARSVAQNAEHYTKELQSAGYATDPNYASKINHIYNSPTLNNAIKTLVDTQ